ncbi:MAG: lipoprotein-releasing ABC transporter permease subunit [Candidatus Firestonebacteria bacterium]
MKRAYDFFISLRYLRARNKQAFFSVITFISLGGITLGVAALIIVIAVMNGFQKDLREKILGIKSHIVIYDKTYRAIPDYQRTVDIVRATKGVVSATPFVFSQGMMKIGSTTEGAAIWGVDPLQQPKVCGTDTSILLPVRDKKPGIILGKELAARIYARVGDEVVIITPIFKTTPLGMIPKFAKYEVVGTFKSGMYEYDATFAYVYLHDAQQLFEIPGRISGIDIRVNDIYNVKEIGRELKSSMDSNLGAYDWMVMNKNLFAALKLEKIVMGIMLTLIILVAVFNVLSSLIMMVMRKRKDIGVLRTLGVSQRGVMKIFIYQGMIIGAVGTFLGAVIGIATSLLLKKYQFIKLSGEVYYIDYIPVELKVFDIGLIVVVSLILSFISTIYPAKQAAKMDPVDAVRYE